MSEQAKIKSNSQPRSQGKKVFHQRLHLTGSPNRNECIILSSSLIVRRWGSEIAREEDNYRHVPYEPATTGVFLATSDAVRLALSKSISPGASAMSISSIGWKRFPSIGLLTWSPVEKSPPPRAPPSACESISLIRTY